LYASGPELIINQNRKSKNYFCSSSFLCRLFIWSSSSDDGYEFSLFRPNWVIFPILLKGFSKDVFERCAIGVLGNAFDGFTGDFLGTLEGSRFLKLEGLEVGFAVDFLEDLEVGFLEDSGVGSSEDIEFGFFKDPEDDFFETRFFELSLSELNSSNLVSSFFPSSFSDDLVSNNVAKSFFAGFLLERVEYELEVERAPDIFYAIRIGSL